MYELQTPEVFGRALVQGPVQNCTNLHAVRRAESAWIVSYRAETSSPPPPVPLAASSSPAKDSASQALWSPDTPEYVPQFTCYYEDVQAEQKAGELQSKPDQAAMSSINENKTIESLGVTKAPAPKPTGYGSSSFAPLAGRHSAT